MSINIGRDIKSSVDEMSRRFNCLNARVKKMILIIGGLSIAIICGLIAFEQMLSGRPQWSQPAEITTPINIHPDSVKQSAQTPAAPMNSK